MPHLTLNWLAILTSILAAFVFGFLWYGPIFGKTWAKAMGIKTSHKPDHQKMIAALAVQLMGTFLTVYVLSHTIQIWRPSVWGVGQDGSSFSYGFMGGFFTWVGFYLPMQLGRVSWEEKPWKVFWINTSQDFITLQIICQILANWR